MTTSADIREGGSCPFRNHAARAGAAACSFLRDHAPQWAEQSSEECPYISTRTCPHTGDAIGNTRVFLEVGGNQRLYFASEAARDAWARAHNLAPSPAESA